MPEITSNRYMVNAGVDDAPHIDEKTKKQMFDRTPEWMRGARLHGLPSKGAGAIYPLESRLIKCPPFQIPDNWTRGYGMDVGWNWTVAEFFAYDANSDIYYNYAEHYMGQEKPIVHAAGIKARGDWIPGWIDPAANGRGQDDGEKLIEQYRAQGLRLETADNDIEAGIIDIWQKLAFGHFKVFETCMYVLSEYEHYRRDENGKIVKRNDHGLDAWRYFFNSGTRGMRVKPADRMLHDRMGDSSTDTSGY